MLVLSRKTGESITILEPPVVIMVTRCVGGKVWIGIEADPTIKIMRTELLAQLPGSGEPSDESPGPPFG